MPYILEFLILIHDLDPMLILLLAPFLSHTGKVPVHRHDGGRSGMSDGGGRALGRERCWCHVDVVAQQNTYCGCTR